MRAWLIASVWVSVLSCGHDEPLQPSPSTGDVSGREPVSVLVFTHTTGFRHDSIVDAQQFFRDLDPAERLQVTLTEDPSVFGCERLSDFDVVVFANTTGDVLDGAQQDCFEQFIRQGGGFVGVHAAADTEHDWAWYGRLVGAYFVNHPRVPLTARVHVEDEGHDAGKAWPRRFSFTDEWYNFDRNPRADNTVLLTVDEADFTEPNVPPGPSMGDDHPVAWYKDFDGGRAFYTNLGHRPETWRDPAFRQHLLAAIRWAAAPSQEQRVVLTREAKNPMALAVAADSRVLFIERTGEVMLFRPDTGRVTEAGRVPVELATESGLLGIALDPEFTRNGFVYLYYSEPAPAGAPAHNVLSRFVLTGAGVLDPASRTDLLLVPSERACCHEAGSLGFGADGLLYLATGDNTDPFQSEGTSPLDERPGRERFDAQRTAANPWDLRGKILRIRADGSAPPGNLFSEDPSRGRPEIYAMGVRNPFRLAVDPETSRVYFADVGPDAASDSPRGPRGYDELNVADSPGHYGWPYCIAENIAYADYDFASGEVGARFDCAGMRPSVLAYDYSERRYPALGHGYDASVPRPGPNAAFLGRTLIAGAVYRPPAGAAFARPSRDRGGLLLTEWTRDLLLMAQVNARGELVALERLLPSATFRRPIDVEVGADGAIYVLEYGSSFWGDNADAALSRIEYSERGALSPVAEASATPLAGAAPLHVEFSAAGSRRAGSARRLVDYAWDFDGDGARDASGVTAAWDYTEPGVYSASLIVTDDQGRRSYPFVLRVAVGNLPPTVQILEPTDGHRATAGSTLVLRGRASDTEDGEARCDQLQWDIRLGHNAHTHPLGQGTGCELSLPVALPDHGDGGQLFYAVELTYTDQGGLTGRAGIRIEVEPAG